MTIDEIRRKAPEGAQYYHMNDGVNIIYVMECKYDTYKIWNNIKRSWIDGTTYFSQMKRLSPNLKPL